MPYTAPLEAIYYDPAGISHRLETSWDFDREPHKGQHIKLGDGFFVAIVDVLYDDNDDAYAKRAYVHIEESGYARLLSKGWTIRE
jgi:hypothetical protein